jgi:hypothetical protein
MDKKKKEIRGSKEFSDKERIAVIEEYLSTNISKTDIWRKYTGYESEHGGLLRWMSKYGYKDKPKYGTILPLIEQNSVHVSMKKQEDLESLSQKELIKRLKDAEMKEECYLEAIKIVEKELNIQILKKSNTK